jgi:hypothetical protein
VACLLVGSFAIMYSRKQETNTNTLGDIKNGKHHTFESVIFCIGYFSDYYDGCHYPWDGLLWSC